MPDTQVETRYNIALLQQVRDQIADENTHQQSLWAKISRRVLGGITDRYTNRWGDQFIAVSCPTAACVAGWAATMTGGKMLVDLDEAEYDYGSVECTEVLVGGEIRSISSYAREQLGLTLAEADALFAGEWSNQEVLDNLDDMICAAKHGQDWEIRFPGQDDEDGGY